MLVLTRRPGESIVIGDGIKLTVVSIGPGRVKIGVEAPPSVRVDRAEIHARIQHEQATDVLAAVSANVIDGNADQATMVNAGSDTGILNSPEAPVSDTPNTKPGTRLSQFRAPRKPR